MNYDNWKRVTEIIKEIQANQDALKTISNPGYLIEIKDGNKKHFMTFQNGFTNEYSEYFEDLIARMQKRMRDNISKLLQELEDL